MAAVSVIPIVLDYFEDDVVRADILPKTRTVYEQNGGDVKIVLAVLACVAKILDKLDRSAIIDEVLPLLFEVKLQDVNVLVRVLGKHLNISLSYLLFFINLNKTHS
jgi:SCY1-like protein 2